MADIYLSTIDSNAAKVARGRGLGLEIAQYCTAWNMDDEFAQTDKLVTQEIAGIAKKVFHGPFNELFPCAIDPKARALAAQRYRQAIALAKGYGATKVVFHGGFHPYVYYPQWYTEQSIVFWKEFLAEDPGVEIVLENVLESEPEWLLDIVNGVDNPKLGLCLDVGHVNAYSKVPVLDWVKIWAPKLRHLHIHNNDGSRDRHNQLFCGTIPMEQVLEEVNRLCPEATITLELMDAQPSVLWLEEKYGKL